MNDLERIATPSKGHSLNFLRILVGLFWLVVGVFMGTSPEILPKILRWNYIIAWIIVFGIPSLYLLWPALNRIIAMITKEVENKSSTKVSEFKEKATLRAQETNFGGERIGEGVEKGNELTCIFCGKPITFEEYKNYDGICLECYYTEIQDMDDLNEN